MIRKIIALALAFAAPVSLVPATAQAQTYFTAAEMNISTASDGSISASFGQSGIVAGMFEHIYQFILPVDGLASGSITTSAVSPGSAADLDLISVFFNGIQLMGVTSSLNEVVFANSVPITAGVVNEIVIKGLSRGNGSYGGQGVFVSLAAVPEPAVWAMLLGGLGFAGLTVRRRARAATALA
ncbi:FxDxF family PEP-CTERM protein [Sphingomonas sp. JC676]|uniref:FxDxF family PEP-CTERM protein n=1 Tax=Sphingomonas sp. JC676 TaxID=2768065 RepID=UPI001657FEF6|nr:FxDxF family PEP-CTERM protein [Sphingomonas sp. JC676]MBC9032396.1 FxDxF family PEP-CTERM protein [Sphingomonas sp. JC676]